MHPKTRTLSLSLTSIAFLCFASLLGLLSADAARSAVGGSAHVHVNSRSKQIGFQFPFEDVFFPSGFGGFAALTPPLAPVLPVVGLGMPVPVPVSVPASVSTPGPLQDRSLRVKETDDLYLYRMNAEGLHDKDIKVSVVKGPHGESMLQVVTNHRGSKTVEAASHPFAKDNGNASESAGAASDPSATHKQMQNNSSSDHGIDPSSTKTSTQGDHERMQDPRAHAGSGDTDREQAQSARKRSSSRLSSSKTSSSASSFSSFSSSYSSSSSFSRAGHVVTSASKTSSSRTVGAASESNSNSNSSSDRQAAAAQDHTGTGTGTQSDRKRRPSVHFHAMAREANSDSSSQSIPLPKDADISKIAQERKGNVFYIAVPKKAAHAQAKATQAPTS